jgi:predicted phosphodiesterase
LARALLSKIAILNFIDSAEDLIMALLSNRYAIISDIHGNLEALKAVIEDISNRGISDVVCLGDIVGYGPCPAEVADIIMNECVLSIKGNHDEALIHGAYAFCKRAREAIDYCRQELEPSMFSGRNKKKRWNYLEQLPLYFNQSESLFVHGSPRDYTSEYILPIDMQWGPGSPKMREIFGSVNRFLFCGHTHLPGIFTEEKFYSLEELEQVNLPLEESAKYIINVGSVGQPRDHNPAACYAEFDNGQLSFHRIPYNVEKTMQQIMEIPQLNDALAKRLKQGL